MTYLVSVFVLDGAIHDILALVHLRGVVAENIISISNFVSFKYEFCGLS